MRSEFSQKVKAQAFLRAQNKCEGCGGNIKHKTVNYDHDLPDDLGGDPTLENCKVLCVACHKEKTRTVDMPRIAKGRRIRKREMGIKKRSMFACARDKKWKKKVTGEVVAR